MWDPDPREKNNSMVRAKPVKRFVEREKKLIELIQHDSDSSDLESDIRYMFDLARRVHPFSESDIRKRQDYSKILGAWWNYMNQLKCLEDRYTLPEDILNELFSLGFEYSKPQKENYKQKLPTTKEKFHAHYQGIL